MALTIRNLTATPVELKVVERFEALPTSPSVGALANITSLIRTSAPAATATQLHENSKSFSHEDVNVPIAAFAASKTSIKPPGNEIVRLTFDIHGERYRIDTLISRSVTLTPLTPKPTYALTAIYLPGSPFLTLFGSAKLNAWMKELKDDSPISALSIPGTHNSPTCHRALPSVRCQAVPPRTQLENGVRFFDLRVQIETPDNPQKDALILVHSVFPISLSGTKYFRDLINEVEDFLDKNPSETIIMSVKREGTGTGTDSQLGHILRNHYAGDVNKWFTAPHVPSLGEARRKIVLMRRFGLDDTLEKEWDGKGWGIDAGTWPDNTAHGMTPSGDVCVQDFYEVLETQNIGKKIELSKGQMDRAAACVCLLGGDDMEAAGAEKQPIYLNFLSASNFWKVGCWPEKIALKLNPAMLDYLCRSHNNPEMEKQIGDGCTGIVVCDWVGNNGDWDLVRAIVGWNARLEMREKHVMGTLQG